MLDLIKEEYQYHMEGINYQKYMHEEYNEEKPTRFPKLNFIKEFISIRIRRRICKTKGHKMKSTSYANTESGSESGYCTRCDFTFNHIMY